MARPKKNLYDILEVHPRARREVVDAAYKALMKVYHTDQPGGNEAIAKEINGAHDILSDPSTRKEYDRERKDIKGTVIGEYRILEFIAEGGFGRTYKGEHVLTGKPVCIKDCSQVLPEYEEVLLNEAGAMWDLRHYSIPAIRSILRLDNSSLALVMSYVPGPTLEKIVEKLGKVDPEHVCWIAERVLNALMYMHYHGVVHGDIKPQNIIVQPESHTVVVVDFGLSLVKPSSTSDSKGYTPYFAPPEQMKGSTLLPESDFYSLGMTMIYALGGGIECVKKKIVPDNVPDALCEFILKLIVRDILKRPRWDVENLCDTIQKVRRSAFGRSSSQMKPLPMV